MMELQDIAKVKISYSSTNRTSLEVPVKWKGETIKCDTLLEHACRQLGIEKKNWCNFTLAEGDNVRPNKRLTPDAQLTKPLPEIWITKWMFDLSIERQMVSSDPKAALLVYEAVRHDVMSGKLHPNHKQLQELEECEDPEFHTDLQYVRICQGMPLYMSFYFPQCRMSQPLTVAHHTFQEGQLVNLYVTKSGIQIHTESQRYHIYWTKVKSWERDDSKSQCSFEVHLSSGQLVRVSMVTSQMQYLMSVISELVTRIQKSQGELIVFHTSMIHRKSPAVTQVDNPMYVPLSQDNPLLNPLADEDDPDSCDDVTLNTVINLSAL